MGAAFSDRKMAGLASISNACYVGDIDEVKHLYKNGADIHKPDYKGRTCLMAAVWWCAREVYKGGLFKGQPEKLCRFLIEKGADLNAQDKNGDTALHYAVQSGETILVEFLVNHGADPLVKNRDGDDAIRHNSIEQVVSSLEKREEILQYLMSEAHISIERHIEEMQLLGCNYVENDLIEAGLNMWRKALELKAHHNVPASRDDIMPKEAYQNAVEISSLQDLEYLCINEIYMQNLLIRERILGQNHKLTLRSIRRQAGVYFKNR